MTLRFTGDFRIAAIGVSPMLFENEDFLVKRNWWLSAERHPEDDLPD